MDYKYYLKYIFNRNKKDIVTHRFNSVFDITFEAFRGEGARFVVFDVDDTLTSHLGTLGEDIRRFLDKIESKGMQIGIYSNCSPERLEELHSIFEGHSVLIVPKAKKPNPKAYIDLASKQGILVENCIMVGDKIGTDLFGAYLAGYGYRILVQPYSYIIGGKQTSLFQRMLRRIEKSLK